MTHGVAPQSCSTSPLSQRLSDSPFRERGLALLHSPRDPFCASNYLASLLGHDSGAMLSSPGVSSRPGMGWALGECLLKLNFAQYVFKTLP